MTALEQLQAIVQPALATNDPRALTPPLTIKDLALITDAIANAGGGSSSYLVYTALLSQTGTDAPVATVLENTLGFVPTYSYEDVGNYRINNTGGFTLNKTFVLLDNPLFITNEIEALLSGQPDYIVLIGNGAVEYESTEPMRIEIRIYL